MKIFVTHSSNFNFKNELYIPLRDSDLNKKHEIFLPQEGDKPAVITKDIIKNSNVVVAEVSYPSTGQGIELGWANIFNIKIICIFKKGSKISKSLKKITNNFIVYDNSTDMIQELTRLLAKMK